MEARRTLQGFFFFTYLGTLTFSFYLFVNHVTNYIHVLGFYQVKGKRKKTHKSLKCNRKASGLRFNIKLKRSQTQAGKIWESEMKLSLSGSLDTI